MQFLYPENVDARSQDMEKHYHDAGQFYFTKVDKYKITKKLMVGNIVPMVLSELEVQDIDSQIDWQLAELKYKLLSEENRRLSYKQVALSGIRFDYEDKGFRSRDLF